MKKIFLGLIAVLMLQSCGGLFDPKIVVDNPTENEIEVTIGEENLTIPAMSGSELSLPSGSYEVMLAGESLGSVEINDSGIINPTGYEYVLGETYYATANYDNYPLEDRVIELNGRKYYGPYIIQSDLFIPDEWDYNLDTAFPEEIDLTGISSYAVRSKIFRFPDFEVEYDAYAGYTEAEIEEIIADQEAKAGEGTQ